MELPVYPVEFRGGGDFKREFSPSLEVARGASGWASQESCLDREMV